MSVARLGIVGARGRMGRAVARLVDADYDERLATVATVGRDSHDLDALAETDVVIDFSLPDGTERLVAWLESHREGPQTMVSGTTGLEPSLLERMRDLGSRLKIMHASNFSPGVAVLVRILEAAAPLLAELGYTPVLVEAHHRHKKDAPSGTALNLRQAMHPFADVQTHAIRAGETTGRHEVTFYGERDRIVAGHEALDRDLFATGAIEAALWLHAQRVPACHDMQSYLDARSANRSRKAAG